MVMYKTVIWKNPENVNIPDESQRETFVNNHKQWKDDFETNYKSLVTPINYMEIEDVEIDYEEFKSKINGTDVVWGDVLMHETPRAYFLFVDV